jgi:hypothetical protein
MIGVLTPRKVTIRRNVAIDNSSNDDNLPLPRHDAWVDLHPGYSRIHNT